METVKIAEAFILISNGSESALQKQNMSYKITSDVKVNKWRSLFKHAILLILERATKNSTSI